MNFRNWLIAERTLYHGTVIDNLDSIKNNNLQGSAGDFVRHAYDDISDLPELVFAADKQKISSAVTAMVHHIGVKLKKDFHDVNDNDILNHGLIVVVKDGDSYSKRRGEDDYEDHPATVEPGDYYADQMDADGFLRGRVLIRLLRRLGEWPRNWGERTPQSERIMRAELIKLSILKHPEKSKQEIINKVQSLSSQDLARFLNQYKLNRL